MKIFGCKDFEGKWSVPTAAVVVAPNETIATKLLLDHLESIGLPQKEPIKLIEIPTNRRHVVILSDGEY